MLDLNLLMLPFSLFVSASCCCYHVSVCLSVCSSHRFSTNTFSSGPNMIFTFVVSLFFDFFKTECRSTGNVPAELCVFITDLLLVVLSFFSFAVIMTLHMENRASVYHSTTIRVSHFGPIPNRHRAPRPLFPHSHRRFVKLRAVPNQVVECKWTVEP